jgi:hypothetical protein
MFRKRSKMQTWNNFGRAQKLITFFCRCSHTCSISCSANVSVMFKCLPCIPQFWLIYVGHIACKISCRKECVTVGSFTWFLTYPYGYREHGVRSGDLGGQGKCTVRPIRAFRTWGYFTSMAIGEPPAADTLQLMLATKLDEFPCCFQLVSCLYPETTPKFRNEIIHNSPV